MVISFVVGIIFCTLLQLAAVRKWGLPAKRSAAIIVIAALFALGLALILGTFGLGPLSAIPIVLVSQNLVFIGAIMLLFYRDPVRIPPGDRLAIVSPADGRIIYIEKREAGDVLKAEKKGNQIILDEISDHSITKENLWQIGISMVFTDVHVNRSPIKGQVAFLNHRQGKFLSLRRPEAVNLNERQTLVIENDRIKIVLVQIASRLVRRIEAYVKKDEELEVGQKIGRIVFGSQVDAFIPVDLVDHLEVKKGEYIYAGETILCRLTNGSRQEHPSQ